ncbi:MAG: hypothetical protein ACR2PM_19920 [Hyphomicrobiales bacterium]
MSRVKTATLAVLVFMAFAVLAAPTAGAGERYWYADIQRHLNEPAECPRSHDVAASRLPPLPDPRRRASLRRAPRYQSRTAGTDAGYAAADEGVSCLQGTHIAREHGFHHIEVVTCEGDGYYVYEALRGRRPWRLDVSVLDGDIVRAYPLN